MYIRFTTCSAKYLSHTMVDKFKFNLNTSFLVGYIAPEPRGLIHSYRYLPIVACVPIFCAIRSMFYSKSPHDRNINDPFTVGWQYKSFESTNTHPCNYFALSAVRL